MPKPTSVALAVDAKNRAVRTLLVNLATDVAVALAVVIVAAFSKANGFDDLEWSLIGFSLIKTAIVTAGSFVLRRFLDPSGVPTPLPPTPTGEPADHDAVPDAVRELRSEDPI